MKITDEMLQAALAAKVIDYRAEDKADEQVSVERGMMRYGFHHPFDPGEFVRAIIEASLPHLKGEAVVWQRRDTLRPNCEGWTNWQQTDKAEFDRLTREIADRPHLSDMVELRALAVGPVAHGETARYTIQTSVGPMACSVGVASEWQKSEERIAELEAALAARPQPWQLQLADALDCAWNPAVTADRNGEGAGSALAGGLAAVAQRLREQVDEAGR